MANSKFAHRVMYDGLYTFGMRMLNMACAAGLGILTARLLGAAGKGIYTLPGVESGLVAAGMSGLGNALSYYMLNRKPGRSILLPAFISTLLFLGAGTAIVFIMAFGAHQLWTAIPASLTLPSLAAVNIASGYAIGLKRVRYATTLTVLLTGTTLVLMCGGLFLISRTPTIAIVAWVAANSLVGAAAAGAVIWHVARSRGNDHIPVGEFLRFSAKSGTSNLVALLNYRADLYIVALLLTPAALGMYTIAVSAAESLLVPTQVAAFVVAPHIGSLELRAAAHLAARCVRNNLIIALIVCGLLFALADPLIRFLYGPAFEPAVPALRILLVGVVAISLASPLASFFTLKLGLPEISIWLAAGAAASCIAASLLLVPHFGLLGAATGSTVGYLVGQGSAFWVFCRRTGISVRGMLTPTRQDLSAYLEFARRVLADGRNLLRTASLR